MDKYFLGGALIYLFISCLWENNKRRIGKLQTAKSYARIVLSVLTHYVIGGFLVGNSKKNENEKNSKHNCNHNIGHSSSFNWLHVGKEGKQKVGR